jgi:hypothetical protein
MDKREAGNKVGSAHSYGSFCREKIDSFDVKIDSSGRLGVLPNLYSGCFQNTL